ncbi:MAG TPA: hypothetical protein VKV20_12760 [Ktedonobacteraceae bacterium]|jgi:hypothetical protein|nr:hypothetical protein [Ktedonobacteraceae bacterium]
MPGSPKCQTQAGTKGCTSWFDLQSLVYKASTCEITSGGGDIECTIKGLRGSGNAIDYILTLTVGGQHAQEIEFAEVMKNSNFLPAKITKKNDMINPFGTKSITFKVKYTGTDPDNNITIECTFRHGDDVLIDECKGCPHTAKIILDVR